jgi:hypothetical protein
MNNAIVNTPAGKFDRNGLPVKSNITAAATSNYEDVGLVLSNGWSDTPDLEFCANIRLTPEEQSILNTRSNPYHIARFDNELDAAYAAMTFNKNREANILSMVNRPQNSYDCGTIPKFKYEPLSSESTEARRAVRTNRWMVRRAETKTKTFATPLPGITDYTQPTEPMARSQFLKLADLLPANAVKVYPTLSNDWDALTVTEFKARYGLE